jgi:hypothetical protein
MTPALWMPDGRFTSRRCAFGMDRNGHATAANSAQSRWLGGSELMRLTAHIGPTTNARYWPSGWPHNQQACWCTAAMIFPSPMRRKSGFPLTHPTNHGTG